MDITCVRAVWGIGLVLICCPLSNSREMDEAKSDLGLSVSVSGPNIFVLGGPIKVTVIARNLRDVDRTIVPNDFGLADFLDVRVVDTDSQTTVSGRGPSHGRFPEGFGAELGPLKPATWRAKEALQFECDLDLYFQIDQPGRYRLELHSGQDVFATHNFVASELQDRASKVVEGKCVNPLYGLVYDDADLKGLMVQCTIQTGRVDTDKDGKRWVVLVGDLRIGARPKPRFGERSPARYSVLIMDVPKDCRVEKSALDFKWQLWTVLVAERERSLVVWDLRCGATKVLVPWGTHDIDLDPSHRAL